MKRRNDLQFEDAVFDGLLDGEHRVEFPLRASVFFGVSIVTAAVLLALFFRVVFLNVTKGAQYRDRAFGNANKEIVVPAPRGAILDRNGIPLVHNDAIFSAALDVGVFLKKTSEEQLRVVGQLREILPAERFGEDVGDIIAGYDLETSLRIPLQRDVTLEETIALKGLNDPSVQVEDDYRRSYPLGAAAAHLLGYTGVGDYDRSVEGKTGLEAYYDKELRGAGGRIIAARDARGNVIDEKIYEPAMQGHEVRTTLDAELQQYFYDRMKQGLAELGREGGAGIALNPQSGEILSLVSFPSFDNNVFTQQGKNKERAKLLTSRSRPLFNRPISGVYTPGSTFKPLVALAALHEGVVDPLYGVYSPGYIELPNPYDAKNPSRFLDWKAHGWVNVYSALARSSNVYFYEVGGGFGDLKGLGIARIQDYFHRFGFDEKTGVDIFGESAGVLYGPEDRERQGRAIWRVGDTYNASIGQGDVQVTPLRLLAFTGAIGAGGKMKQPFLMKEIVDSLGNKVEEFLPKDILDFSYLAPEIAEVQRGLEHAVSKPYGTAHSLADLPMTASGKTGSSQIQNNTKVNAFFVGYAPAENPEIAILVLIEDAKEGSLNTIPIVEDVLRWYYENRMAQ